MMESERKIAVLIPSHNEPRTIGARLSVYEDRLFRPFRLVGNALVRGLVNKIFGSNLTDIMSGYRAFNRRVMQRIPVVSAGFEVETEMTIQMLYYRR